MSAKQTHSQARRPPMVPTEHAEQSALIRLAQLHERKHPELRLLHAIPNGIYTERKKTKRGTVYSPAAVRARAEGVRSGVPDLMLPVARDGHHGLYIEMKRTKGGTISPEQADWIANLRDEGYRVEVCKGCDAAWMTLCDYLGIET